MNVICEMQVTNYFKLSTGQIALVGNINPNVDQLLTECQVHLYIRNKKIRSINIIGEERFSQVNEQIRKGRRAVRTNDDIYHDLILADGAEIKLVFYTT